MPSEITGRGDYLSPVFDHRTPHSDDHGIQFEIVEDFEQLKHRHPFTGRSVISIERILNRVYGYLDRVNAYRAEHPDE